MSGETTTKRCTVAYATRDRQYLWRVELPQEATVADALATARAMASDSAHEPAPAADARWEDAAIGIFGELCSRADVPRDGDRIEIYRPLAQDPRQARRERTRRLRSRSP
jgi:uncharacterized protein